MVKKVAFINGKGGVGKTTCIYNVAGVLAKAGHKVLVLDLDKQRNTTDTFLLYDEMPEKTIMDYFSEEATFEEVLKKAQWRHRGNANPRYYGVDIIPADIRLEDEELLASINVDIKDSFDTYIKLHGYDWVLVDMPPSNKIINEICFEQIVDYVIAPLSADQYAVSGYGDLIDIVNKSRAQRDTPLGILGVFFSRYETNASVDRYLKSAIEGWGKEYLNCHIPHRAEIRETTLEGRPISYYKPLSTSCKAFNKLANVMDKRVNELRNELGIGA